jgi:sortase (surface protein transpeptidase)
VGSVTQPPPTTATPTTLVQPPVLTAKTLSLDAPPAAVPVIVEIPSIHVSSHLLSVGMTAAHAMAAPEGAANSLYWADTFWYRGGSLPGAVGTATIAGHIDNRYGSYAVFGHLSKLVRGDLILLHFTKSGLTERFVVTRSHAYTLAQTMTKSVLDLIYGTGPPAGRAAAPSADGLAHLSLVSCTGTWDYALGTHNERLVVSAVRIS